MSLNSRRSYLSLSGWQATCESKENYSSMNASQAINKFTKIFVRRDKNSLLLVGLL